MPELRGSFLQASELVLGEYTLTEPEASYVKGADRAEAARALSDMGAAAVLVDGKNFTAMDKFVCSYETLPIKIADDETLLYPGKFITMGIELAERSQKFGLRGIRARRAMRRAGLTAHTVRQK